MELSLQGPPPTASRQGVVLFNPTHSRSSSVERRISVPFSLLNFSWLSCAIFSLVPRLCLACNLRLLKVKKKKKIDDDLRMSSSQVPIPSHLRSKSPLSPPEIPSNNRTTSVTKKMSQDYDEFEFEYTKVS